MSIFFVADELANRESARKWLIYTIVSKVSWRPKEAKRLSLALYHFLLFFSYFYTIHLSSQLNSTNSFQILTSVYIYAVYIDLHRAFPLMHLLTLDFGSNIKTGHKHIRSFIIQHIYTVLKNESNCNGGFVII